MTQLFRQIKISFDGHILMLKMNIFWSVLSSALFSRSTNINPRKSKKIIIYFMNFSDYLLVDKVC